MSDLIDRQGAIDAITDELDRIDHVPQWVFDRLEERLKQLPPAQLGTNLADVGTDSISRQAAIDGINKLMEIHFDRKIVLKKARDVVEQLPPAQPEREKGEWIVCGDKHVCSECDEFALCDAYDVLETGEYQEKLSDFCPNCGADMRGEQE